MRTSGFAQQLSAMSMFGSHAKCDDEKVRSRRFLVQPFIWRKVLRNNTRELCYWLLFCCIVVIGYKFLSDGTFSAVLTLSSAFQCFAFVFLLLKIVGHDSPTGISAKSLQLFLVALISRLSCNLLHNAYLPVDRSGDWVYQVADIVSVAIIAVVLVAMSLKPEGSYPHQLDATISFCKVDAMVAIPLLLSLVLSLVVKPKLVGYWSGDLSWAYALYLESFSMIPQLILMSRLGGEIEVITSHYVGCIAASKGFAFMFWLYSYRELSSRHSRFNIAGYAVLLSYLFQLLLLADFVAYYIRSLRTGKRLILSL